MRWVLWYLKPRLQPHLRRWRPYLPVAVVVLVALVCGLLTDLVVSRVAPLAWQAERAADHGDLFAAERLYWRLLQQGPPEVPVVLSFLDINAALTAAAELIGNGQEGMPGPLPEPTVDQATVKRFLTEAELPEQERTVCRYWYDLLHDLASEQDHTAITTAADRQPPVPWANHVLARKALMSGDQEQAAARFEREGLREGGPRQDLAHALALWQANGDTAEILQRLDDARYRPVISPLVRADLALNQGDWSGWLLWMWPASYLRGGLASWLLAALAAGLWLWFCWRLGGIGLGLGWQVAAFALGALSIYPTHLFIVLQEELLGLTQRGNVIGDAIYFTLGVGLREEGAKLLCFLPLLLVLRRTRHRGAGLVLGALVGLGFAAVENVSYVAGGHLATGLGRFLTANFLHMSLTAIVAEAAAGLVQTRPASELLGSRHRQQLDSAAAELLRTFGLVVVLHGLYDLLLVSPQLNELSFLAMTTLIASAQRFLRAVPAGQIRAGMPLYEVVALALVILAAAIFVYGSAVVGPAATIIALGEGLLGVALITLVFHRELAA